jgi:Spy/CpxP family protein refolding chaperone
MQLGLNYIAPLLAAGAAAVAIAAAPIAAAAPTAPTAPSDPGQAQQSCANLGGTQSECQTPGNVQLNDAPPQVDFFPYAGGAT